MPIASVSPLLRRETAVHAQLRVREWSHDGCAVHRPSATTHPTIELALVERGELAYRIEGRDVVVRAGDAMVVPAGTAHETVFGTAVLATVLCLGREMVDEISDAMGPDTCGRRLSTGIASASTTLAPLCQALRSETSRAAPGSLLAADALGEAIVVEMLRTAPSRASPSAPRDPRVAAAIDRIHASYADDLDVDNLAKSAGMSRFHFSRLFRDQVGDAPYRHLLRVRIARAAELLRRGHHDVTEAALAVGFRDLGRFGRMFKRELGCRPSELARASRRAVVALA